MDSVVSITVIWEEEEGFHSDPSQVNRSNLQICDNKSVNHIPKCSKPGSQLQEILRNNFPFPLNLENCPDSRFILLSHFARTRKFKRKSLFLAEIKMVNSYVQFPGQPEVCSVFSRQAQMQIWLEEEKNEWRNREGSRALHGILSPFPSCCW